MNVDLVWIGAEEAPAWPAGRVLTSTDSPQQLSAVVDEHLATSQADAWLFWDASFGPPDPRQIMDVWADSGVGHVRHAGLLMGTAGLPSALDFIHPTAMQNCDADPLIESTSWRLSLRACLSATDVLRQLGGPRAAFDSLDAAGLEMGHRYLRNGAIVRHTPKMLPAASVPLPIDLSLRDELRFAQHRFGNRWARWAFMRGMLTRRWSRLELIAARRVVEREVSVPDGAAYSHPVIGGKPDAGAKVTVLIPTLERYPYLETLLEQLRRQTVRPFEVIVIDQTPATVRDVRIAERFADLPIQHIQQDEPGQCTSRNEGILRSTGDWILLLDDDIEIEDDLIERHLRNCARFGAEVSSGVAIEAGAGPLPASFRHLQVSGVFPAGNTLVRRSALQRAGLFDLAFNRGQRADGDLGMRVHLSGALMILDPAISIFHHHAPRGGLRAHKARIITRALSRGTLTQRHLPSASEIYLMRRYFRADQVREALWLRALGTLSLHGTRARRWSKAGIAALQLPDTVRRIGQRYRDASHMLKHFPNITRLPKADT